METKRSTNPLAEEILGLYFPVLDHGFVSLVDYMGSDEDVEQAARVSYGSKPRGRELMRGLIRFLRRHKHTTPSEMVELKFHCCMPIFIARQWIRHRTANVNEASGRYSLLPMLFYTPEHAQLRKQSKTNKQGRGDELVDGRTYDNAVATWRDSRKVAQYTYEWLGSKDVAKELARIDLPLSTYTQWYWKIDLHNLMHFLGLRVDSHAQWEIQQYGRVMAGMMKRVAPLSFEAWVDYDVDGARLSRMELDVLACMFSPKEDKSLAVGSMEISVDYMKARGMSDREIEEFHKKFFPRRITRENDFDLDLASAKPAAYFEEKMVEATPKTDTPPTS